MPFYDYDEDGDLILSDEPEAIDRRAETARRKAIKEADPERYGLPMDPKSVANRKETREKYERAEEKIRERASVLKMEESMSIGVPTMKMATKHDEVKPALPDPRDKAAEPEPPIPSADITQVALAEPLSSDQLSGEQILTTVSRQLHIMSEQIEILKTLVSK